MAFPSRFWKIRIIHERNCNEKDCYGGGFGGMFLWRDGGGGLCNWNGYKCCC